MNVHTVTLLAASTVPTFQTSPNAKDLPGTDQLSSLASGLGFWALLIAIAAMVVGAAMWAIGNHSQNYQQSFNGRRTVITSGLAALVIGAAPALVSWFFSLGQQVKA
jgi:hypothetical protein